MKAASRQKLDQRAFLEQVMNGGATHHNSKKIGSGAFSKVYLAYATRSDA